MSEPAASPAFNVLTVGDPAPWFRQRTPSNPSYTFDVAAGRYLVLCFFGSASDAAGRAAIDAVLAQSRRFDAHRIAFFGVSTDPSDESEGRIAQRLPGIRFFWDFDRSVSRTYGAAALDDGDAYRRCWFLVDPTLRVLAIVPFAADGSDHATLFDLLDKLPPPARYAGFDVQAPVLILPNVFEPGLCHKLIELYQQHGGEESGFMREVDGKTVLRTDPSHKRRKDYTVTDPELMRQLQIRMRRRVVPEILKVHQFKVTRMERYIVSCYAAEDGGHFHAHRDNTTKGTAHRRFAVSINLNDDFEGGEISFPEYGPRSFKMVTGGAVVFSCSLLHAVSHVTAGRRYAFLPFLYDEEAAKLRETNAVHLEEGAPVYRA
jgi:peroxiredoxin/predicted 2-oxoglutarate/Fe(II)-dependent dioxygenase YbiX